MSIDPNSLSLFGIADITYLLAKMEVLRQGGEQSDRVGEKVHCCDEVRSSFLPYDAIVCVSNFSCYELSEDRASAAQERECDRLACIAVAKAVRTDQR